MITEKNASKLAIDDIRTLQRWCSNQRESLWDDLDLQQILNVYHAASEYVTAEAWLSEAPHAPALYQAIAQAGTTHGNRALLTAVDDAPCRHEGCTAKAVIISTQNGTACCAAHAELADVLDIEAQNAERYASRISALLANPNHYETFASKDRLAIEAGRHALINLAANLRSAGDFAEHMDNRRTEDHYRRTKRGMR